MSIYDFPSPSEAELRGCGRASAKRTRRQEADPPLWKQLGHRLGVAFRQYTAWDRISCPTLKGVFLIQRMLSCVEKRLVSQSHVARPYAVTQKLTVSALYRTCGPINRMGFRFKQMGIGFPVPALILPECEGLSESETHFESRVGFPGFGASLTFSVLNLGNCQGSRNPQGK